MRVIIYKLVIFITYLPPHLSIEHPKISRVQNEKKKLHIFVLICTIYCTSCRVKNAPLRSEDLQNLYIFISITLVFTLSASILYLTFITFLLHSHLLHYSVETFTLFIFNVYLFISMSFMFFSFFLTLLSVA